MGNELIVSTNSIKDKIHTIRGVQVILDQDIAELYDVETRRLNEQVKRNRKRFPAHFMFQLDKKDLQILISQNATSSWGGRRKPPYAFTEQGVAMLSGVLKSDRAVTVSIQIMEAFVAMRKFISSNAGIFQRLSHVEQKQLQFDEKFEKVFNTIEDKTFVKKQGIFFDGQIFDAYNFVSDLIRSAKESIILIDNFVDDTVLTLFSKRGKGVSCDIYTENTKDQLKLDLKKHNTQYPAITLHKFKKSHDRFLILDDKEVYHIGASLKDLGKKWFAFSKFDRGALEILGKLR